MNRGHNGLGASPVRGSRPTGRPSGEPGPGGSERGQDGSGAAGSRGAGDSDSRKRRPSIKRGGQRIWFRLARRHRARGADGETGPQVFTGQPVLVVSFRMERLRSAGHSRLDAVAAAIYSASLWRRAADGLDSRWSLPRLHRGGNECGCGRPCVAYDTITVLAGGVVLGGLAAL